MATDPTSPVFDEDGRATVDVEFSKGTKARAHVAVLATADDGDVARPAGTAERPLKVDVVSGGGGGTSGGLTDAELRASAVPVAPNYSRGAGAVEADTQRVTLANDGPVVSTLGATNATAAPADGTGTYTLMAALKRGLLNGAAILAKLPDLIGGRFPTENLSQPGVARQLAAGSASANTALTATCRRISIFASVADIRFAIGTGAQTASATSHFIGVGERLDLSVPANANIAVIRAGTINGTLELTELV